MRNDSDKGRAEGEPSVRVPFTPGPWETVPPKHPERLDATIGVVPTNAGPGWRHIASIYCTSSDADANAALIVGAPDLYEVLRDALREADECRPRKSPKAGIIPRPHFMWRERARAALAKAEGRSAAQAAPKDSP